jgi:hypothetical protein
MKMPDSSALDRGLLREVRMRALFLVLGTLIVSAMIYSMPAQAQTDDMTLNFAVMRNDQPIGTSLVRLRRDGQETIAEIATHVRVKIAYVTVYRFDQAETEHWAGGTLLAMTSLTNDNGTVHKVTARRRANTLSVDADGKASEVNPAVIPVSLWNASVVQQTMALNPQDGTITPVSVVDHGEEQLVLQGRPTTAHHYSIRTSFPQDVWYDEHDRLVKVELRGSDGSRIHYQLG